MDEMQGMSAEEASFDEMQTEVPAAEAQAAQAQSFYEVDEVPEELRPVYDRMQTAYTQQRQKDTETIRNMRQEVEKFQGLLTDPSKLRAYLGALEAQGGGGESLTQSEKDALANHPGINYKDMIDESLIDPLDYMIQERIEARVNQLMPELQTKLSAIDKIQQERVMGEWQQLAQKYPVVRSLENDPSKVQRIQAIMDTGASMEDALLAVAGREILAEQKKALLSKQEPAAQRAAGAAQLTQGGAPMRGTPNGNKSKARLMEAIREARSRGL